MQRRTVLRSAVKLAYASPLIVATAKLGEQHAFACSPAFDCGPCALCSDAEGCLPIPGCTTECRDSGITVSGTVTDAVEGFPIYAFLDFPGAEVETNYNGAFTLTCITADCTQCGYSVQSNGYVGQFGMVSTLGLTDGGVINFQLVPV